MVKRSLRALSAFVLIIAMVGGAAVPGAARGIVPGPGGDAPILRHGVESIAPEDEDLEQLLARDAAFIDGRTAGDNPLSVAQAVAPSNDLVVYAGTGEGALSGDSYFGNGILKSTDGGNTWSQVSGDFFVGVSTTRLAVDPTNANHLYASISRGRGGARRTSPTIHSTYGIWESTDGAVTWTLKMAAPAISLGATDIRMDPQNPANLYASFWSDKVYKSTDGGATWAPIMNGFPTNADFAAGTTRFALAISHPAGQPVALYAGFDWTDTGGAHHTAKVWRSNNEGASWAQLPTTTDTGSVSNYCGGQCFYDNVIEADPSDGNIVYAGGQVSGAGGGGA